MPLVRLDEGVVLEPDGSNRLTLLNADKAVKRWGFEPSQTPAGALGHVVARRRRTTSGGSIGAWRVAVAGRFFICLSP